MTLYRPAVKLLKPEMHGVTGPVQRALEKPSPLCPLAEVDEVIRPVCRNTFPLAGGQHVEEWVADEAKLVAAAYRERDRVQALLFGWYRVSQSLNNGHPLGTYSVQQHCSRVIPLPHFRLLALFWGLPHLQPNSSPTEEELLDRKCFANDEGCGLCDLSRAMQTTSS